jgi:2-keto-4-pentenoate hydratase/2-oxohepta-3-ene-1,7-dioic acid hydratase in catechol pathway
MPYALATLRIDGKPVPVIESGGHYWPLSQLAPDLLAPGDQRGLMALMDDWEATEAALFARLPGLLQGIQPLPPLASDDDLLAPLLYPGKVCCTGANYRQHMAEVGLSKSFDKSSVRPAFFLKPARTAVVGSGRSVRYPEQTRQFDWEIELAVVIGRKARHVDAAFALQHVAGYTVGLDLSARDYLLHPGNMAGFDTFGGKAFDDSCPLGPSIIPARFVPDPQNLSIRLDVNGQVKQDSNTSEMVWTIAEQIAEMSAVMTLEPGDVILTGTPSGSGLPTGTFLKPGDRVVAEIGTVGRLAFEVVPSFWAGVQIPCALRPSGAAR